MMNLGFNVGDIIGLQPRMSNASPAETRQLVETVTSRLSVLPASRQSAQPPGFLPYCGLRSELEVLGKTHSERWQGTFEACDSQYFESVLSVSRWKVIFAIRRSKQPKGCGRKSDSGDQILWPRESNRPASAGEPSQQSRRKDAGASLRNCRRGGG